MPHEVVIPRLGLTMEEGRVAEWHKQDGEIVEPGEALFSVETDKAVMEVQAAVGGVLRHVPDLSPDALPIGAVIGYITQPGAESAHEAAQAPASSPSEAPAITPEEVEDEVGVPAVAGGRNAPPSFPAGEDAAESEPSTGRKLSSPAARRRAGELGLDWRTVERPGGGPILEVHVEQATRAAQQEGRIKASPAARRMAQEAGIELGDVAARGPGAVVRPEDVAAAVAERQDTPSSVPDRTAMAVEEGEPVSASREAGDGKAVATTGVRRVVARRMAESARTVAAVTLTTEADATELVEFRERQKAVLEPRNVAVPTYNDFFVKLVAAALREHPALNAYWREDQLVLQEHIHIGIAVDAETGLVAPVVRDVPSKSLRQVAEESRALAGKARAGRLAPDEMQGGTFTVTNLGAYGIDAFTPIVNLPQCAILGIGRIVKRPAVFEDRLVARSIVVLSLTFDHRAVDGGPAARFLDTVRQYAEQPYLWL